MSINGTLRAVLDPIAPAEADADEGKKGVYITFNYDTVPTNYGDEPDLERVSLQVHLYAHSAMTLPQSGGQSRKPSPRWALSIRPIPTPRTRTDSTMFLSVRPTRE